MGNTTSDPIFAEARAAAREDTPFSIKSYTLPREVETQLQEILLIFLTEVGQESIADSLGYCLRELTTNAKKANTKRVYFAEHQIDLQDTEAYNRGMNRFKRDTLENIQYWLQKQEEAELYIRVTFCIAGRELLIAVSNNSLLTEPEYRRIYDRITRSRGFQTMEEAVSGILDDTEGAGLGIMILVLMLKKIGLGETALNIAVEGEETVARIRVPVHEQWINGLHQTYRDSPIPVSGVPQHPEQLQRLKQALTNQPVDDSAVASQIKRDAYLTAELLRRARQIAPQNPASGSPVDNEMATLRSTGLLQMARECAEINQAADENVGKISQRVGWYSYALARTLLPDSDQVELAYLGGLLHALGTALLPSVAHPPEAGAYIAEQWNLDPPLIACIRFYRNPRHAPDEYINLVSVVHLAYVLADLDDEPHLAPEALRHAGVPRESVAELKHQLATQYHRDFLDRP